MVQLRERVLGAGASEHDVDRVLEELGDPMQWFVGPAMVAVWGRRPSML